ncbi:hypothetical protein KGN64_003294 [Salmonella enterica]|nr:hypothetical protein [Salmonella enterica]EHM5264108.1 hypothetical protein [Salmonella enterica]
MSGITKHVLTGALLIFLSFGAYIGYQTYYKNRTGCYMQGGIGNAIAVLAYQFQYDFFRAIVGVVYTGNVMISVDILMNEKDIDKYPQFFCRSDEEILKARQTVKSFHRG